MTTRPIFILVGLVTLMLQGCTVYPTHPRSSVFVHDHNRHLNRPVVYRETRYIQPYYGHQKPVRYQKPPQYTVPAGHHQRDHKDRRHKTLPNQYRPKPVERDLNRRKAPRP